MVTALWSAKGGVGTTVVACSMALSAARRGAGCLLVDLAGDAPAVLGMPDTDGPGALDWLAAADDVLHDGLARLEVEAAPGLGLVTTGATQAIRPGRAELLVGLLGLDDREVVVDLGVVGAPGASGDAQDLRRGMVDRADRNVLVTRACYVALRRALRCGVHPTSVVVVGEPGRALGPADVEAVLGAPVATEVPFEPSIARAVDAGLLASRLPRTLRHALEPSPS